MGTDDFRSPLVTDADALRPIVRDPDGGETLRFPPLGEFRRLPGAGSRRNPRPQNGSEAKAHPFRGGMKPPTPETVNIEASVGCTAESEVRRRTCQEGR